MIYLIGSIPKCGSPLFFKSMTKDDTTLFIGWNEMTEPAFRYEVEKLYDLSQAANRFVWLVADENKSVGFVDLEIDDGEAWFGFMVAPELRNQGYGTQMLQQLKKRPELQSIKRLKGGTDKDNVASRCCLEKCQFKRLSNNPNSEGSFNYQLIF